MTALSREAVVVHGFIQSARRHMTVDDLYSTTLLAASRASGGEL